MGVDLFIVTGPSCVTREELVSHPLPAYIPAIHMGPCESVGKAQGGTGLCATRVWLSCSTHGAVERGPAPSPRVRSAAKGSVTAELGVWTS